MTQRVIAGISGGVDSAVAAHLLKQRGLDVRGVFMKNWESSDETHASHCPAEKEFEDAQEVCRLLDIPLQRTSFVSEYWTEVFEPMLDNFSKGITPNPDAFCNRHIKFDSFLKYAQEQQADFVATGHYAGVRHSGSEVFLTTAKDQTYCQTYFLSMVRRQALQRVLFPLGGLLKEEVRAIAEDIGLPVAHKKSSTGICFIGPRKFDDFLSEYITVQPGPFVNSDGLVMGEHQGAALYTIGQRAGVSGAPHKYFVYAKDLDNNVLYIAPGTDNPLLFSNRIRTRPLSLLVGRDYLHQVLADDELEMKITYRARRVPCSAEAVEDEHGVRLSISCGPVRGVAPGQIMSVYHRDVCLGGAIMDEGWHTDGAVPMPAVSLH